MRIIAAETGSWRIFLAGFGGAVIGYAIGFFTGTNPWGLLVGLFLGIVVAFRNIIRAANRRPDE